MRKGSLMLSAGVVNAPILILLKLAIKLLMSVKKQYERLNLVVLRIRLYYLYTEARTRKFQALLKLGKFCNLNWGGRVRTYASRSQSPLPYHLATPHNYYGK